MVKRVALVAALFLLAAPGVARANGDPASDYLLVQSVFLPFNAKVDPQASKELADTIRAANEKGFKIKVAVIGSRYDLGTAFSLYNKAQRYSQFLGLELSFQYRDHLLVVMLKILIDYPAHDEELTIVQRQLVEAPELRQALTLDDLKALQQEVAGIYVDPALVSYAVDLATATRQPGDDLKEYISFGASPRGPISLVQASRALALVRGRDYVLAEDLQTLMKDAMRHRLVLTYQALAEEMSPDAILDRVLSDVPVPATDLARPNVA